MPPPPLLLQDISLTFGVTALLRGAALAIAAGDRICLVGRNGSHGPPRRRVANRYQSRPASLYDSPLEGDGFELVWGFSCQVVVFGFC